MFWTAPQLTRKSFRETDKAGLEMPLKDPRSGNAAVSLAGEMDDTPPTQFEEVARSPASPPTTQLRQARRSPREGRDSPVSQFGLFFGRRSLGSPRTNRRLGGPVCALHSIFPAKFHRPSCARPPSSPAASRIPNCRHKGSPANKQSAHAKPSLNPPFLVFHPQSFFLPPVQLIHTLYHTADSPASNRHSL